MNTGFEFLFLVYYQYCIKISFDSSYNVKYHAICYLLLFRFTWNVGLQLILDYYKLFIDT